MNVTYIAMALLVLAGALTAIQGPSNARLSAGLGSVINGAFVSFVFGTIALGIVAMLLHVKPESQAVRSIPWWGWIGGLYGCVFVTSIAWGIPKLGVATTMTLVVAGQLILGVILDHFGALGTPSQPISFARMGGIALIVGGALLVRRG